MLSKTQVRKAVGRGKFSAADLASAIDVSAASARRTLRALVSEGVVEPQEDTEKIVGEDGEPHRGRPRHLFKVASGK